MYYNDPELQKLYSQWEELGLKTKFFAGTEYSKQLEWKTDKAFMKLCKALRAKGHPIDMKAAIDTLTYRRVKDDNNC